MLAVEVELILAIRVTNDNVTPIEYTSSALEIASYEQLQVPFVNVTYIHFVERVVLVKFLLRMEFTLRDVSDAIANRRQCTFNRVRCFVVNYSATNDFPHKFLYNGCSVVRGNGTYCARATCDHATGLRKPMYRFQLQLTDFSPTAPLTVTIFDQARNLLGISPEQLSMRSPEGQVKIVREKTSIKESIECNIKVKEDSFSGQFVGVVQLLLRVDDSHASSVTELARSDADFHTPRSADYSVSQSSASTREPVARERSSQLSNVKSKLQDLIDAIDLTSLD